MYKYKEVRKVMKLIGNRRELQYDTNSSSDIKY